MFTRVFPWRHPTVTATANASVGAVVATVMAMANCRVRHVRRRRRHCRRSLAQSLKHGAAVAWRQGASSVGLVSASARACA